MVKMSINVLLETIILRKWETLNIRLKSPNLKLLKSSLSMNY